MINSTNLPFELYSGIIVAASISELCIRAYKSKTDCKIALAIAQTFQNLSLLVPVAWTGVRVWNAFTDGSAFGALTLIIPFGALSYFILGIGLTPIHALTPNAPKDLAAHVTPLICNGFRTVNTATIFLAGNLALSTRLLTVGAITVTMIAQNKLN